MAQSSVLRACLREQNEETSSAQSCFSLSNAERPEDQVEDVVGDGGSADFHRGAPG
jgi:hypothetical protein